MVVAQCLSGVVPKPFGTKPVKLSTVDIAARCLLIEEGNLILIDTGMGIAISILDTILYGDHILWINPWRIRFSQR
jgi:hypothetical protein